MTSHTDKHGDLEIGCQHFFFNHTHTHSHKIFFRKPSLSVYACKNYSQHLCNAAMVFNKVTKVSLTKNFSFGCSTKILYLLADFHNESHLLNFRHHKKIKTKINWLNRHFMCLILHSVNISCVGILGGTATLYTFILIVLPRMLNLVESFHNGNNASGISIHNLFRLEITGLSVCLI